MAKLAALPPNGIKLKIGSRPNRKLVPGTRNWLSINVEIDSIQRKRESVGEIGLGFMGIMAGQLEFCYPYEKNGMQINLFAISE
jgi:hypothetical protein